MVGANLLAVIGAIAVPLTAHAGVRDLGPAPANYPVSIVVTLPYRNPERLERLIQAQADPSSPSYHRFLTPQQFAAWFGPTAQEESTVVRILQRAGFTVSQRFANRTVIDARAPALVAERYFHTGVRLALQSGSVRYYNDRPAAVPSELSAHAFAITGLSNVVSAQPKRPNLRLTNEGGYGPGAWANAYDLPISHKITASNVKVAEIENAEAIPNGLIRTYSWAFGVPMPTGVTGGGTTVVPVDGGCSTTCSNQYSSGFDKLDYDEFQEFLAALAPGIDAYLYQTPDDSTGSWTDAFNAVVADNHADVVAIGGIFHLENEPNAEAFALALDHVIQQGSALGMTFVAPGLTQFQDSGIPVMSIPADSPHVLTVGSSNLQVDGSGAFHSEASCEEGFASPSISAFFPEPAFKSGIAGVSKNGRDEPDIVSAQWIERSTKSTVPLWQYAGQFPVYVGGLWWPGWAWGNPSPIVALAADLDQINGSRSGLLAATIFNVYKKQGYGPPSAPLFRDITQSTPGGAQGTGALQPKPGYDWATGIGSVDGWNLALAMRKRR